MCVASVSDSWLVLVSMGVADELAAGTVDVSVSVWTRVGVSVWTEVGAAVTVAASLPLAVMTRAAARNARPKMVVQFTEFEPLVLESMPESHRLDDHI